MIIPALHIEFFFKDLSYSKKQVNICDLVFGAWDFHDFYYPSKLGIFFQLPVSRT
jgi:hypothetical protein